MVAKINLIAAVVTLIASSTSAWAQSDLAGSGFGPVTSRRYRPEVSAPQPLQVVIEPAPLPGGQEIAEAPAPVPFAEESRGTFGRPHVVQVSSRRSRGQIPESRAWEDPNAPQATCRGHMVVLSRGDDRNTNREVETRINLSNMGRNRSSRQSVDLRDQHEIFSTGLGTLNWTTYHNQSGHPEIEIEIVDRSTNQVVYRRHVQGRWDNEIEVTIRDSRVVIPLACSVERSVARRSR